MAKLEIVKLVEGSEMKSSVRRILGTDVLKLRGIVKDAEKIKPHMRIANHCSNV